MIEQPSNIILKIWHFAQKFPSIKGENINQLVHLSNVYSKNFWNNLAYGYWLSHNRTVLLILQIVEGWVWHFPLIMAAFDVPVHHEICMQCIRSLWFICECVLLLISFLQNYHSPMIFSPVWLAVGMMMSSVCQSVCLCIVALMVSIVGWKLYRRVPRRALPIHFFRHFCCRMYRLAS